MFVQRHIKCDDIKTNVIQNLSFAMDNLLHFILLFKNIYLISSYLMYCVIKLLLYIFSIIEHPQ